MLTSQEKSAFFNFLKFSKPQPYLLDKKRYVNLVNIQKERIKGLFVNSDNYLKVRGGVNLKLFEQRSSVRNFTDAKICFKKLCSIINNALGTRQGYKLKYEYSLPKRRFPSAGGLNSIEVIIYAKNVENMSGFYYYNPYLNILRRISTKNILLKSVLPYCENIELESCSCILFLFSNLAPLVLKYGPRGYRYGLIEAGHMAQNIALCSEHFGIGTVHIGAFNEQELRKQVRIPACLSLEYITIMGVK